MGGGGIYCVDIVLVLRAAVSIHYWKIRKELGSQLVCPG
jgi:hypothetical protein